MTKKRTKSQQQEITIIKTIKPKTVHQEEAFKLFNTKTLTILNGVAGTGKSYITIGYACSELMNHRINRVLISRPLVGCGSEIGSLPGTIDEKVHPYMSSYMEYLDIFLGRSTAQYLIKEEKILIIPTELLRGHTFNDHTLMILEEAQNCTLEQIKLFLSRIGTDGKIIMCGDIEQSDIRHSGFEFCMKRLQGIHDVGIIHFTYADILRHPIIAHILEALRNNVKEN